MKTFAIFLAALALAACSADPKPDESTPVASAPAPGAGSSGQALPASEGGNAGKQAIASASGARTEADYLGRWIGVEGMYLDVAAKPGGGLTLDMQWDLDHHGRFDGSVTAEGLRFMRDGIAESALHTNGDATGLKYLEDKKDCLTVKPGEGYCRD